MEELIKGLLILALYFAAMVSAAFLLRSIARIPTEVYRKLLHCIALVGMWVWTAAFQTWYLCVLTAFGFAVISYPMLALAERIACFSHYFIERHPGEFKKSMSAAFFTFGFVITVCWGFLEDRMLGLASIFAWGFGDAAAALVGKRFGRHGIQGRHIQGRKSWEGTLVMFTVSFVSVCLVLWLRGGMTWYACVSISMVTAAVSAAVELYSLNGRDTVYCSLAAMGVLILQTRLYG